MLKRLLLLLSVGLAFAGCKSDEDGLDGTASQQGLPVIESVSPGNERFQITWSPNDSEVEGSYICWNDGEQSEFVYFPAGTTEITSVITVETGKYTIYVRNVLSDGSLSDPSFSMVANVYDSSYIERYEHCPIESIDFLDELEGRVGKGGVITWGDATSCVGNMVYYEDSEGNEYQKYCAIEDGTSYFDEADLNSSFRYVSYYVPVSGGLDVLATEVSADGQKAFTPATGTVTINSLAGIIPYLARDGVDVILKTGTYQVGPDDVKDNPDIFADVEMTRDDPKFCHSILLIRGNNSTYDFGNSTIEFDNNIMNTLGYEFFNMYVRGSNTTVKNLTIQDVGDYETYPVNGSCKVLLDGRNNYLENVEANAKGSYPWGYGELFGKGTGIVISMFKNGGILVRGEDNHLYRCRVKQQSICHMFFFQGAWNPLAEECYLEGMMITTDEVLDDTRSKNDPDGNGRDRAIDVGFVTDFWDPRQCPQSSWANCVANCMGGSDTNVHNYTVPEGFTISLTEDGFRTYNISHTYVDGVYYGDNNDTHQTKNIKLLNCIVKHGRGGITLPQQSGYTDVQGCTNISSDRGIAAASSAVFGASGGSGGIGQSTCYSDFQYGMAFNVDNEYSSQMVDITLINVGLPERINGYKTGNNVGYTHYCKEGETGNSWNSKYGQYRDTGVYYWPSESLQQSWSLWTGIDYDKYTTYQPENTPVKVRQIANIFGSTHRMIFRADTNGEYSDEYGHQGVPINDDFYAKGGEYIIKIGGDEEIMDNLFQDNNYTAKNSTIVNQTKFRVVLDEDSSGIKLYSAGPVEDYGSGNTVYWIDMDTPIEFDDIPAYNGSHPFCAVKTRSTSTMPLN